MELFPAQPNSPQTQLAAAISSTSTTIPLLNASVLPDPPNLATMGIGDLSETVKYTGKSGNSLTGVTRGFEAAARDWPVNTLISRNFTAHDMNAMNATAANAAAASAGAVETANRADAQSLQAIATADQAAETATVAESAAEQAVEDARDAGAEAKRIAEEAADIADQAAREANTARDGATAAAGAANTAASSAGDAATTASNAARDATEAAWDGRDAARAANTAAESAESVTANIIQMRDDGEFNGPKGEQGPQGDQGPVGPGVPAGGTAGQVLVKASGDDYDTEWTDALPYTCTGTNDDLAIQNIINNFFNAGTAMTMRLVVTGKMGLQATPASNYQIRLNSANTRGAVAHIDFSDCDVPEITQSRHFLCADNAVKLVVTGLRATTNGYALYVLATATDKMDIVFDQCDLKGVNSYAAVCREGSFTFNDCRITSANGGGVSVLSGKTTLNQCTIKVYSETGSIRAVNSSSTSQVILNSCVLIANAAGFSCYSVNVESGVNMIINDCKISSTNDTTLGNGVMVQAGYYGRLRIANSDIQASAHGMSVSSADTGVIINVTGCDIASGGANQDIYQGSATSTISWNINGCRFSKPSIRVNGALHTYAVNDYVYMPEFANKFNQTI